MKYVKKWAYVEEVSSSRLRHLRQTSQQMRTVLNRMRQLLVFVKDTQSKSQRCFTPQVEMYLEMARANLEPSLRLVRSLKSISGRKKESDMLEPNQFTQQLVRSIFGVMSFFAATWGTLNQLVLSFLGFGFLPRFLGTLAGQSIFPATSFSFFSTGADSTAGSALPTSSSELTAEERSSCSCSSISYTSEVDVSDNFKLLITSPCLLKACPHSQLQVSKERAQWQRYAMFSEVALQDQNMLYIIIRPISLQYLIY